jgi:hypothetical protein
MGQSLVAEARIADRVKDELCKLVAEEPSDIIVRFYGSANAVTGARMYRDVDCSGSLGFWLRFGGLKTVVLGGSGHLEELDPHGAPTF